MFTIFCQALSHPWLGLLLIDGETEPRYSRCAATLVWFSQNFVLISRCPRSCTRRMHVLCISRSLSPPTDQQQLVPNGRPLRPRLGQNSPEVVSYSSTWGAEEKPVDLQNKVESCLTVSSSLSRKFHITDVKIHEDYDYILQQNDIALIKSSKLCLEHGKKSF